MESKDEMTCKKEVTFKSNQRTVPVETEIKKNNFIKLLNALYMIGKVSDII